MRNLEMVQSNLIATENKMHKKSDTWLLS